MDFDEPTKKKSPPVIIGEDLNDLSISELHDRLDLLHEEIDRLENEIVNKKSTKSSAESVFKI